MDAQHHVLRHVFGVRREPLAEDGDHKAEYRSAVAPHQFSEGGLVGRLAAPLHEPLVSPFGIRRGLSERARRQGRRYRINPTPRNASGSGNGQSVGACGKKAQGDHGADAEGRPHDAMNQRRFRIRRLRDSCRIERQLGQRNALVHGGQALLVDDLEAAPPLDVAEVQVGHDCRGDRRRR